MTRTRLQRQLMILGLGGQGILYVSRVLAEAAMLDGDEVLTAETHGMAQRGGAVEAHLKLGDFRSSLVRPGSAQAVVVLHPTRIEAAQALLEADGICVANAPQATEGACTVDAYAEAQAMGYPRGQNLILLGRAVAAAPDLFPSRTSLLTSIERRSPEAARAPNRTAFERGFELANDASSNGASSTG